MTSPEFAIQDVVAAASAGSIDSAAPSSASQAAQPTPLRFRAAKVFLALPAYNEQESLPELLERIGEAFADSGLEYEVVIVDDGSRDDTAQIASQMSFQMPLHLVRHSTNQGLGRTIRDGLREAVDRAGERDIIITMDADNTHPPGLINRMVQSVHEGCDCVIASRFQTGACVVGVPFERHLLSIGARVLFTILFPTRGVRDYTSGYRAYRASVIRSAFDHYGDDFVGETGFSCMADVLLKLRAMKCVFGEVPLRLRYDQKGGESKMRVFHTIGLTLKLLARHRFVGS
ncbi:glycosyltransferase [Neorhodopirellula pilleata]|uniref:Undecaprenyl-phosphate mannosyltransferase n=1 Tax=Neorhodopirellula pilleata TaxID=2714738 RepID=A0A5C6AS55_9BACT|nr:glycosyltransferase [Neorhodopirellula pilleata]TWU01812.1 Undecaprenyl-phosphate mannosyltransferase [Neorhodopirellula pilleata]